MNFIRVSRVLILASTLLVAGCPDDPVITMDGGQDGAPDAFMGTDATPDATPDTGSQCANGTVLCGDTCVDTQTDSANCGACDRACMDPSNGNNACVAGMCELTCEAGFEDCNNNPVDGCEVDTDTPEQCGGCDVSCSFENATPTCVAQTCAQGTCDAGFDDCNTDAADGCEVDTMTDVTNCGGCGVTCGDSEVCMMGVCDLVCTAPLLECAQSCRDTATDAAHCGGCDVVCPAGANEVPVCGNSMCSTTCSMGFDNCNSDAMDGCETPLNTVTDCGACGTACNLANATAACTMDTCAVDVCDASFSDCNVDPADGCEVDTRTDDANCGMCGMACGAGTSCFDSMCLPNFESTVTPIDIPNSTGCSLILDTNADQIDVLDDGTVAILLRCAAGLSLSMSNDGGRTFGAPTLVSAVTPDGASILVRSAQEILVLIGDAPDAQFLRSTDGGATFSMPVTVGTNFQSSGPGPSTMLLDNGGLLVATWSSSTPSNTTPIVTSNDQGVTWTSLPDVALAGPNYCPDLGIDPGGNLLMANEVNRQVFRFVGGVWTASLGTLGPASAYTDFAVGGPYAYGTGSRDEVSRAPTTVGEMFTATTLTVGGTDRLRSMDSDTQGNLSLVLRIGDTLRLHRWVAGSAVLETPINLMTGATATPAVALAPNRNAAVVAYYTANTEPVRVHVQSY